MRTWPSIDSFGVLRNEVDRLFRDFSTELAPPNRSVFQVPPFQTPVSRAPWRIGATPSAVVPGAVLGNGAVAAPAANVWEDEANLFLEMEIPGFTIEELDLAIVENRVTIAGSPKKAVEEPNGTYHRRERRSAKFSRTLELPVAVQGERVEALLKNGVLTVRLPKAESAKRRKIAVTTPN